MIILLFLLAFNIALAEPVENYDSGKNKIISIMENSEYGVRSFNKNIVYAETQNLSHDLNIPEISKFFKCHTVSGQTFLTQTLTAPLGRQHKDTILVQRQHIIRMLVENPELKKQVDALLKQASVHEQEVIKLMSEFFIGKTCPELKQLEIIKQQNPFMYPTTKFLVTNPTGKAIGTGLTLTSAAFVAISASYYTKLAYDLARSGLNYSNAALMGTYMVALDALYGYALYKDYSTASEKRVKLHALNQLIAIAEQCDELSKEYRLENQFSLNQNNDAETTQLIKQLKHSRYNSANTKVFLTPSVHSFLYNLYEKEQHLAGIFATIAEMDAYNAIATQIIASEHTEQPFCFANFMDQTTPSVHAEKFWNILVPEAITNSVHEHRKIILSGPNAGGKTTAIRALLQNIVLAQSFGVAAAQKFEITFFDVIHSYLNISDDILKGLSLFASEIKRAQEIITKIKSLDADKKYFFALDELFTGTVSEDGEVCAYEFIKNIAAHDNVQFVYATHFNKLKQLGEENINCTNFKVDAPIKSFTGKLHYPYTLSRGASAIRVAIDLAQQAHLFS